MALAEWPAVGRDGGGCIPAAAGTRLASEEFNHEGTWRQVTPSSCPLRRAWGRRGLPRVCGDQCRRLNGLAMQVRAIPPGAGIPPCLAALPSSGVAHHQAEFRIKPRGDKRSQHMASLIKKQRQMGIQPRG